MTTIRNPLRILVVEDESLLAMVVEDALQSAGYTVIGPFGTIESLEEALAREKFDLALLDVNLHGKSTLAIAERLHAAKQPIIILSGYGNLTLSETLKDVPCLLKPYEVDQLIAAISRLAKPAP